MKIDTDKNDQAVLALLALGQHVGFRTWKGFNWESMSRLHRQGLYFVIDGRDSPENNSDEG